MNRINMMVRRAMLESGLRQRDLARLVGISESTITRRLNNPLPFSEAVKYCDLIKQEVDRRRDEEKTRLQEIMEELEEMDL